MILKAGNPWNMLVVFRDGTASFLGRAGKRLKMDIAYTFDCYFYKLSRFFAFYTAYFSWRLPEI